MKRKCLAWLIMNVILLYIVMLPLFRFVARFTFENAYSKVNLEMKSVQMQSQTGLNSHQRNYPVIWLLFDLVTHDRFLRLFRSRSGVPTIEIITGKDVCYYLCALTGMHV